MKSPWFPGTERPETTTLLHRSIAVITSRKDYPIFDSYVEKMLRFYAKADQFASFKPAELRNYERFVQIIREFREFYKLTPFSLRDLDIFLWYAGKECFPREFQERIAVSSASDDLHAG